MCACTFIYRTMAVTKAGQEKDTSWAQATETPSTTGIKEAYT